MPGGKVKTALFRASIAALLLSAALCVVHASPSFASGASNFSGVLQDSLGNPVSGEQMDLSDSQGDSFTTTTASDGSFSLTVNPGVYDVTLTGNTGQVDAGNIDLSQSETGETLTLPPFQPITLTFSDTSGAPMSGLQVGGGTTCETETSQQFDVLPGVPDVDVIGSYTFGPIVGSTITAEMLPCAVTYYDLNASSPGYSTVQQSGTFPADGILPVVMHVAQPTFSGVVKDLSGNPVAGAFVQILPIDGTNDNGNPNANVTANSNGSFSTTMVAGQYQLTVASSLIAPQWSVVVGDLDMTQGNLTNETLTVPLFSLNVDVTDSSGNPVSGATVTLGGSCSGPTGATLFTGQAFTNALSYFSNDPVSTTNTAGIATFLDAGAQCAQGSITTTVVPPTTNLAQEEVTTQAPFTSDVTVPVVVSTLSGTLTDSSGQALVGQTVAIESAGGTAVATTQTTGTGRFALTAPPGSYAVDISGSVGDPTNYNVTVPGVNLTNAQQTALLLPTEAVSVVVTGGNSQPIPNATVEVACSNTTFQLLGGTASGSECISESTNANGEASLTVLPANQLTATVMPPAGSGLRSQTVTFSPSNGLQLPISLLGTLSPTPTPTISGTAATGKTLTAVPGTWQSGATLSYQWLRNGVAISSATSNTHVVVAADVGKSLTVAVTATLAGYTSITKTSAPVTPT